MAEASKRLRRGRWRVFALVFLAVSSIHLIAQLTNHTVISSATQVLLMSTLAITVFSGTKSPRTRVVNLLLLALFFSWLGDTLPRLNSENSFLIMVGFFLIAQLIYIWLFWPYRKCSILHSRRTLVLPYLVWFVVLIVLCTPKAGTFLVPTVIYGVALLVMAILSTSFGPIAALGGALFFLSDSLIAIRSIASIEFPLHSFFVMLTYIAAQALISYALVSPLDPDKR